MSAPAEWEEYYLGRISMLCDELDAMEDRAEAAERERDDYKKLVDRWEDHTDHYKRRAEGLRRALDACVETMDHARVFIRTREKMHADGIALFDGDLDRARAALHGERDG